MSWKVVVGVSAKPWADPVEETVLDPTDWEEADDEVVPGYRRARFPTEVDANAVALALRALGLNAATALAPAD